MKVTVLVEDRPGSAVDAEHGLALLVETTGYRILFDTGASPLVVKNAESLYLGRVWRRLNTVVLSHGHYDHTGGLASVLDAVEGTLPVDVGEGFFRQKYRRKGDRIREIGVPWSRKELEGRGARFVESQEPRQVGPGFFVSGKIERRDLWDVSEPELCIRTLSGSLIPDPFSEELVLVARTDNGLIVFVGCAHKGLLSSIAAATDAFGQSRIQAVFGGAHLRGASNHHIRRTAQAVARLDPGRVALGHCTGEAAERIFSEVLGHRFESLKAGDVFELE